MWGRRRGGVNNDFAVGLVVLAIGMAIAGAGGFVAGSRLSPPAPPGDPSIMGQLAKTPGGGIISYTRPDDAPDGGPWCYVVQKIMFPNKEPKDGAASMVYARTCEELPMLWLKGRG